MIFLAAPEKAAGPSDSDLASLFDLSPMQTQIALRLFRGESTNEIADKIGITQNTIKTHLRRLYGKLRVGSQSELMRLFAKLKSR